MEDLVEMTNAAGPDNSSDVRPSDGTAASDPRAAARRPPAPLTEIIGREREIIAVRELITRPSVRLVTVTGPGGVGKTRLAIEVVADSDLGFDAVVFVPLAPVGDPEFVTATIALSVGLRVPDDLLADELFAWLHSRRVLLVLDNVEHLLPAAPILADLLNTCPRLTMLVTSRTLLRISGEHVVTVPPMNVPVPGPLPSASALDRYDAIQLFVTRARAAQHDFAISDANAVEVVGICRRLDGLPLAIELAAARITVLPPRALLNRLNRRLPLLIDGARDLPERLRTMRASIAWSYELLSAAELAMFGRLAVFAGTCTLSGADFVNPSMDPAVDIVAALVDKSLLQASTHDDGEPRFAMLETVREFAIERLADSGEESNARRAHAAYFLQLAEAAERGLRGPHQQSWRNLLEADLDNLRAALTWTVRESAAPEDAEIGLLLVGALWYFWFQRGLTTEARRWLARALATTPSRGRPRAAALLGAGTLAWRQGDCPTAQTYLDESASLWAAADDQRGLAEAKHVLGHVRFDQRDYTAARRLFQDSLEGYRGVGDTIGGLPLTGDVGLVAYHEGDYETAEQVLSESLTLYRAHGLKDRVAGALNSLGDLAQLAGDGQRATELYEESLVLWRELRGAPGIASALHKLGQVRRSQNDNRSARTMLTESLRLQLELGNKQGQGECLAALAATTTASGQPERAAKIFAASSALLDAIGVPLAPVDRLALNGDIAMAHNQLSNEAWDAAWALGSRLSTDDAIELALIDDAATDASEVALAGHARPLAGVSPLSRREYEVSQLLANGLTNREIAHVLSISEKTVGSHIDHIMTKLGLRSRTRIAVWAVERRTDGSPPD
jgi:predicted ATPase/DNA-binding CsgD family transcriptional regulator